MCYIFMANYFLMICDAPVEMLLITDFVNLKIKSIQSFEYIYRSMMYEHIFIGGVHMCMYCVSQQQKCMLQHDRICFLVRFKYSVVINTVA
jgi:hypothetical protein